MNPDSPNRVSENEVPMDPDSDADKASKVENRKSVSTQDVDVEKAFANNPKGASDYYDNKKLEYSKSDEEYLSRIIAAGCSEHYILTLKKSLEELQEEFNDNVDDIKKDTIDLITIEMEDRLEESSSGPSNFRQDSSEVMPDESEMPDYTDGGE